MGMEQFCCPTSAHVCCIKKYSTKTWPHRGAISLLLKKAQVVTETQGASESSMFFSFLSI